VLARKLLHRPELGVFAAVVAAWLFFAFTAGDTGFLTLSGTASYLAIAAELGILAAPVALLMIAGEFDLSIGSTMAASGMTVALCTTELGWPLWAGFLAAVTLALLVGLVNGFIVTRTKLPSFIVTLGTLFILAGGTIGITRLVTGRTQVGGVEDAGGFGAAATLFAGQVGPFSITLLWWIGLTALTAWVLSRTRAGNWIFAVGGAPDAARRLGIPVDRVKILLFMTTSFAACLVATFQVVQFRGADVLRGTGKELEAILAAVLGGTLLTGGRGSVLGAACGALLFGMVQQGIVFSGVDSDWYKVFLGAVLIGAVLLNNSVQLRTAEARR
jgi:simple sugar transport system permease protein